MFLVKQTYPNLCQHNTDLVGSKNKTCRPYINLLTNSSLLESAAHKWGKQSETSREFLSLLLCLYHEVHNIDKRVFCYTQKNALPFYLKCRGIYKWYGNLMLHLFPSKWEGGQNALSKLQKWQNKCINNCTKTSRTCCTSCTWYFICAKSNMRIIYFGVMVQHSF